MIINICGIPHEVQEVPTIDENLEGITQGKILFSKAKILLKQDLPNELKKSVLFHEVLHGILELTGYSELSGDEAFVQCLSNVMYQMFDLKESICKESRLTNGKHYAKSIKGGVITILSKKYRQKKQN